MTAAFFEPEDEPEDELPEDVVTVDAGESDDEAWESAVPVAPDTSPTLLPVGFEYVTAFVDAGTVLSTVALWPYVADHEATDLADGMELSMRSMSSVLESKSAIAIPIW